MSSGSQVTITSVIFSNYKALRSFTIKVQGMNILVGSNNCGKSTVLSAFRALSVGIRRALNRKPEIVRGPDSEEVGYRIAEDSLTISIENVHTDYADEDTTVEFRLSNKNSLVLYFPSDGGCVMLPRVAGKPIRNPSGFKREFPITIAVVPVLGPVEHNESIVQEATVRQSVGTHRASRHFRNYWRYNPSGFEEFAELVSKTWPAMEIAQPEKVEQFSNTLMMFCYENRMPRELYWAGFGFQVWCQILTHISRASRDSVLVVDEPEIYLHPDVQRQLLGILREAGPDVVLATHSTEIMSEADPSEILLIDKTKNSAMRLRDIEGVQAALDSIGSIQNITLTQLARNSRVLFVEGMNDFKQIRRFAKLLGMQGLASGTGITPVESGGFSSWEKLEPMMWGFEKTLGQTLSVGAVLDRDFWPDEQVADIESKLKAKLDMFHIHQRKEMENYLLVPPVLQRAFDSALKDRARRDEKSIPGTEPMSSILDRLTKPHKMSLQSKYLDKRSSYMHHSSKDGSTLNMETIEKFEAKWNDLNTRMEIVEGKATLKALRTHLQQEYKVNLTDVRIIDAFEVREVPHDVVELLGELDSFRGLAE